MCVAFHWSKSHGKLLSMMWEVVAQSPNKELVYKVPDQSQENTFHPEYKY